ncbi:MAG: TlpA family protein disulfide reductase [Alphaproteobacteria bacterium]|nr:TlpA family protein disulfide reductase [Alphaproteobacteria bacterium]
MLKNSLIVLVIASLTAGLTILLDHAGPPSTLQENASPAQEAAGEAAPDFTLLDRHGKSFKLSDFKGKKVILNFWASWCAPCVEEFPRLLELAQKNEKDTVLLALSSDFEVPAMNRFLARMEKEHPAAMKSKAVTIALDPEAKVTQGLYQTHLLPETILIDAQGVMREKIPGSNWSVQQMQDKINGF